MIERNNSTSPFECGAAYLPDGLYRTLRLFLMKEPSLYRTATEIRLRDNGYFSLSVSDKNIIVTKSGGEGVICTREDIDECVRRLCADSYQSHEGEIEQGYISSVCGIRAGVACSASPDGGVHTINSVSIRIPHEIRADVSPLFSEGLSSCLIFSPPGVGKTTVLRECIRYLSSLPLRVAVIDTRYELKISAPPPFADYVCGIERGRAIEAVTRTMYPQVIICDEIGGEAECDAILTAQNTGVPLIATAHGNDRGGIMCRPSLARLINSGVFSRLIRLSRTDGVFVFDSV